ncbi:hypothetical protein D3C73_1164060 [compost metagenome]
MLFEQFTGLFQRGLAAVSRGSQGFTRGIAGARGILQLQAILGLELFDLREQFIETRTRRRIEKPLAQRSGAQCTAFAEHLGDARGDVGDEFAQLAHVTLAVVTQAGLAGDNLAEDLGIADQFADQCTFALQGFFRLLGLERADHFIALAIEQCDLLRIGGHRRQPLQACQNALFQRIDLRLEIRRLAGLAQGDVDLHKIVQGLQITP